MSPAGAYAQDPTLTGKANFGLVSKYEKGQSQPTGDTTFKFKAGKLSFESTSYEWLIVNPGAGCAKFRGKGILNGDDSHSFMLSACDSTQKGKNVADTFRIKITFEGDIVYDNKGGDGGDDDYGISIGGGNVVIHKSSVFDR